MQHIRLLSILFQIALATATTTVAAAASLPDLVPIAHWRFDEVPSTVVADARGRYPASVIGASSTSETAIHGLGQRFAGGYLEVPGLASSPKGLPAFLGGFALSGWIKVNQPGQAGMLATAFDGSAGWYVAVTDAGRVELVIGRNAGLVALLSDVTVPSGQWCHVAVSHDRPTGETVVYVDGRRAATATATGTNLSAFFTALTLAASRGGANPLDVSFDDLKLFNAPISDSLVQADVDAGGGPKPAATPVLHLTLDETSLEPGQLFSDTTGNGYDAEFSGAHLLSVPGVAGTGIYLDGSGVQATVRKPIPSGDCTFSAWVAMPALPQMPAIVFSTFDGTAGWYISVTPDGSLMLTIGTQAGATSIISSQKLQVDRWHHVAGRISVADASAAVLIDGSVAGAAAIPAVVAAASTVLPTLGGASWTSGSSLNGALDDVQVYARSLTDAEINPGRQGGSGPDMPPGPPNDPGPIDTMPPYSPPTPLRTIQVTTAYELEQAIFAAQPGDEIVLAPARFSSKGGSTIAFPNGVPRAVGTAEHPIVIRSADPSNRSTIDCRRTCFMANVDYIRFEDLNLEGRLNIVGSDGFRGHVVFMRNYIYSNAQDLSEMLKLTRLDGVVIRNNRFEMIDGTTRRYSDSFVDTIGVNGLLIQGNIVINCFRKCFQLKGGTTDARVLENTIILGGERAIQIGGQTGFQYYRGGESGAAQIGFECIRCEVAGNRIFAEQACWVISTQVDGYVHHNTCFVVDVPTSPDPDPLLTGYAMRILQENPPPIQRNQYARIEDNIIAYPDMMNAFGFINLGKGTMVETFTWNKNAFFQYDLDQRPAGELAVHQHPGGWYLTPAMKTGWLDQVDPELVTDVTAGILTVGSTDPIWNDMGADAYTPK